MTVASFSSSFDYVVNSKVNFAELEAVFQLSGEKMENQKRPRDPLEENTSACSGKNVFFFFFFFTFHFFTLYTHKCILVY